MIYNDPSIYLYQQPGFQFPFSNESLTDKKIQFIEDEYNGVAKPK